MLGEDERIGEAGSRVTKNDLHCGISQGDDGVSLLLGLLVELVP